MANPTCMPLKRLTSSIGTFLTWPDLPVIVRISTRLVTTTHQTVYSGSMADKRNPKDNVLINTAKAIGAAAGKVASLVGATPDQKSSPTKRLRKGKLIKRDNPHMPRRMKKEAKKRAARSSPKA